MTPFYVLPGPQVRRYLNANRLRIMDVVENAYRAHELNTTVNPHSYFLRPDDRNRIIALPAHMKVPEGKVSGLKWIASYPDNLRRPAPLPRASAVMILNDGHSGRPFALLEASGISAARTAASAVLGAFHMNNKTKQAGTLGVIGAGVISRTILEYFKDALWSFDRVIVNDIDYNRGANFAADAIGMGYVHVNLDTVGDSETVIGESDIVILATTALSPHIKTTGKLDHKPLILHISLRDLYPSFLARNVINIVDDVDHCLREGTSLHLAEQQYGHRDFVHGTIGQLLMGTIACPADIMRVFSPFGLGVLDLAVAYDIYRWSRHNNTPEYPDFF